MSDTKKKMRGISSFFKGRKFRQGGYTILLTVLFIAIIVVLNIVVDSVEDKWGLRIDATANKLTSFSDQTYSVVDAIDQDVHIYLVYDKNVQDDRRITLEEVLNKYQARNGHIKVETIEPLSPDLNKYTEKDSSKSLSNGAVVVTNADETRVKLITAGEFYTYAVDQNTGSYYISGFNGESKLTTALMYVTSDRTPIVYFLTGHNEYGPSYCSVLKTQLANENYDVLDLTLGPNTQLNPGDTVLINMPSSDLTNDEYEQLKAFLNGGGRMMFVNAYNTDYGKMPNFKSLLSYYAVSFERGYVVEDEKATDHWIMDTSYLIPTMDTEDDITSPLTGGGRLIMPMSGAIRYPEMPLSGYRYTKLLTSSESAHLVDMNVSSDATAAEGDGNAEIPGEANNPTVSDASGPFTLAMSIYHQEDVNDSTKDTRIVLIASPSAVIDNDFFYSSNNLDFTMNAFDWLSDREVSVYIRSKANADTSLKIPDAGTFWLVAALVVIVIPAMVLVVGIIMYIRRRRL